MPCHGPHGRLEHVLFRWSRNVLRIRAFAHILIGGPASTPRSSRGQAFAGICATSADDPFEGPMLDAAIQALLQMFSPPFRTVLLKSLGLAIALLVVVVIALYRLLAWLTSAGESWAEGAIGGLAHGPLAILGWLLALALGFGLIAGAIFLMPAVT